VEDGDTETALLLCVTTKATALSRVSLNRVRLTMSWSDGWTPLARSPKCVEGLVLGRRSLLGRALLTTLPQSSGERREYPEIPGYEMLAICGHGGMGVV
jgi:hypothetical protein